MVPVKFVVPSGDDTWPEASWGYALGKHAEGLRKQWREREWEISSEQLKQLEEMPFAWDLKQYKWDHYVLPALRRFYKLNGHTDVQKTFRIPTGDAKWPERLWGQKLGLKVHNIRSRGDFAKQVEADAEELERIKFCHDSTLSDRDWREKLIPALKVFRQEFGHCDVGQAFTVPSSSPWPKAAWKMGLGRAVNAIRVGALGVGRDHRELDELGFVWDYYEKEWSERILPALKVYFKENGHSRVPASFEVPSESVWPTEAHGLKLGYYVLNIRYSGYYFDCTARSVDTLQAIGFELKIPDAKWRDRVEPLLATFEKLHGHRNVPRDFVVPSEAPWNERDWGIQLGKLEQKKPVEKA